MFSATRNDESALTPRKHASILRNMKRWIARVGLTLLLLTVVVILALLTSRYIEGRILKAETAPTGPNRIEELFSVRIHGTNEWILLRGDDRRRPVLFILNGGPGNTGIGLARAFGALTGLERDLVVASWDQPNTGKSDDLPRSQRHISRYVDDACEVVKLLTQRLGTDHVYVAGISWGSFLGILTTARCSEQIAAFFGTGQLVNPERADEVSYTLVRDQALRRRDTAALHTLDGLGKPPWTRQQVIQLHNLAAAYGGVSQRYKRPPLKAFCIPEFSTLELIRSFAKEESIGEALWAELHNMDLNTLVPALRVPVFFLIGRLDLATPPDVARQYFDNLSAPRKEWIWFDHSAHGVLLDEPERAGTVIKSSVLQVEQKYRTGSPYQQTGARGSSTE